MLDEISDFLGVFCHRSVGVKLLDEYILIELYPLLHTHDVIVDLVLKLPKLLLFVTAQVSPLFNLQLQVVDGFFGLEDERF